MCCFPVTISNPTHQFRRYYDKVSLTIPCGHCEECRSAKRSEWFVRAYYEYLCCYDNRGFVIAPTLTYNDEYVPIYCGKLCFSKDHIQLALKRLRRSLNYEYGRNIKFKYLICSEYGGQTHRSHYHGLFFVYDNISVADFMIKLQAAWIYGGIRYSKKGAIVKNAAAIKYATKYITKDLDFEENFDGIEVPKDKQPRHYQSKGFGEYMIEKLNLNNSLGYNLIVDNFIGYPLKKDGTSYKIPAFIKRKLLYDLKYKELFENKAGNIKIRKLPVYKRNSMFFAVSSQQISRKINEVTEQINILYNSKESILNDGNRLEMFNKDLDSDIATPSDVWRFLAEKRNSERLAIYSVLYDNRIIDDSDMVFDNKPFYTNPFAKDSIAHQSWLMHHVKTTDMSLRTSEKLSEYVAVRYGIYNRLLPQYDYCIKVLRKLRNMVSLYHLTDTIKLNQQKSNLKLIQS